MKVQKVSCNRCGAPLDVPVRARFVTCGFCDSRLEVHRTENAVTTDVLDSIDERTERIARDVEALRAHSELERIDREWALERDRFLRRGRDGTEHLPHRGGSIAIAVFGVVAGGLFMAFPAMVGAPPMMLRFTMVAGLAFMAFAVIGALFTGVMASRFQRHHDEYVRRRREALHAIQEERGGS